MDLEPPFKWKRQIFLVFWRVAKMRKLICHKLVSEIELSKKEELMHSYWTKASPSAQRLTHQTLFWQHSTVEVEIEMQLFPRKQAACNQWRNLVEVQEEVYCKVSNLSILDPWENQKECSISLKLMIMNKLTLSFPEALYHAKASEMVYPEAWHPHNNRLPTQETQHIAVLTRAALFLPEAIIIDSCLQLVLRVLKDHKQQALQEDQKELLKTSRKHLEEGLTFLKLKSIQNWAETKVDLCLVKEESSLTHLNNFWPAALKISLSLEITLERTDCQRWDIN